ncbi:MAG: excisionase family DNA-binding protein [Clostridium sp.]|nr:excisionase family DNA-binding protein [Clostridium sp.]MCM1207483.1 excisionase family DNA-binding protein [Ruminococcus sp.]
MDAEVPIKDKITLTVEEAAAYSNIGVVKIRNLIRQPGCNFVLFVGTKRLIKRKEFEQYISRSVEI